MSVVAGITGFLMSLGLFFLLSYLLQLSYNYSFVNGIWTHKKLTYWKSMVACITVVVLLLLMTTIVTTFASFTRLFGGLTNTQGFVNNFFQPSGLGLDNNGYA